MPKVVLVERAGSQRPWEGASREEGTEHRCLYVRAQRERVRAGK